MRAIPSLVQELRQRRVGRALLAYGAGVAAVLQGADMVFTALAVPDLAYRIVVITAIAGFPLVAILAWMYDLTAIGLRRAADVSRDGGPGRVPFRRYLQVGGAFAGLVAIVLVTAGAVSSLRYPYSDDGSVGLAIFPFRTLGEVGEEWSEGAADLLATALEGTPSLRVVDPWSLWSSLRPDAGAAARIPPPLEAASMAEAAGARRFLLGAVVAAGPESEVSLRRYRVGRDEPLDAFTVTVARADVAAAVRAAA
ncbi:MAG: hypothetical protein FIA95_12855, partial [Gemmatimonadetes bacterium]|nr:hypothetical protein [Gemmatimonadota bacterium]